MRLPFKRICHLCGQSTHNPGMCDACKQSIEDGIKQINEGDVLTFQYGGTPPVFVDMHEVALTVIATGTCREWLRQHGVDTALIGEADLPAAVARFVLGKGGA